MNADKTMIHQPLMMEPNKKEQQQQSKEQDTLPWAWINAVHDELSTGPFKERQLPAQVLPWLLHLGSPSALQHVETTETTALRTS